MTGSWPPRLTDDFASVRRDEVGLFFRWATWRYYMLPQFVMQNVWLNGIEKRAKVSDPFISFSLAQNSEAVFSPRNAQMTTTS